MTDAAERIDGRAARAARTRSAIVDAHLALIEEGDLRPTGERIAERAGVSLRALWANFRDMEALFRASGERLRERSEALFRPVPPDLPFTRRVEEFCRQRARILELIAPSARAAALLEPFSAQLRANRKATIEWERRELSELFAAEFEALGPAREEALHAITVVTTYAGWAMMRDVLGLEADQASAIMARTLTSLLKP